jgi:hypothetical protein
MANPTILVVTGNYQLGNNPGLFQEAPYVGLLLRLPLSITWLDTTKPEVKILIETHDIETWGKWMGHAVLLNGQEIGRLKDPDDTLGRLERFEIVIPMAAFVTITGYSAGKTATVTFEIVLETQPALPGFADDFVFTRLETSDVVVMKLGW